MQSHKKYQSVKQMIALVNSDYGKHLLNEVPSIQNNIFSYLIAFQEEWTDKIIKHDPDIKRLKEEIDEYLRFKNILSDQSLDSIQKTDEKLEKLQSIFQDMMDYDSLTYFNTYFLLNGAKPSELSTSTAVEDFTSLEPFKKWFSSSKVVKTNAPLMVYHGTNANEFTKFQFEIFPAMYFAEKKSYSEWFATKDGVIFECYLRITNAIDLTLFKTDKVKYEDIIAYMQLRYGYELPENKMLKYASDASNGLWTWQYIRGGVDWLKYIKEANQFDGITFYENNPSDIASNGEENVTKAWLVFSPNQIKLANGNVTYSFNSNDVRFKDGGLVE